MGEERTTDRRELPYLPGRSVTPAGYRRLGAYLPGVRDNRQRRIGTPYLEGIGDNRLDGVGDDGRRGIEHIADALHRFDDHRLAWVLL